MLNKVYNLDYAVLNKKIAESKNKVDMLLTDIPYNLRIAEWDSDFSIDEYLKTVIPILRKDRNIIGIWCHLEQTFELFKVMSSYDYSIQEIVIWQKTNSLSKIKEEHCYIFTNTNTESVDVSALITEFNRSVYIKDRTHSCQKPLDILEYITNKYFKILYEDVQRPLLLLDNFIGSASTITSLIKSPLYLEEKIRYIGSELHLSTYKRAITNIEDEEEKVNYKGIVTILEQKYGYSKYTSVKYKTVLEDLVKLADYKDNRYLVIYKRIMYFYILFNFRNYRELNKELDRYISKEDKLIANEIAKLLISLEDEGELFKYNHDYFNFRNIEVLLDIDKQAILKVRPRILNGKKRNVCLRTRQNRYKSLIEDGNFQNRRDYNRKRGTATRKRGNYLLNKYNEELNTGEVSSLNEFLKKHGISKSTYYYQTSKINNKIK